MTRGQQDEAEPAGRSPHVQSVTRAAHLLKAIATTDGATTARDLAEHAGINRATAWRILQTLEAEGLVSRDPRTRHYAIGASLVDIVRSAPGTTWAARAHGVLRRLSQQTLEVVALARLTGGELWYVDEAMPDDSTEQTWIGTSTEPFHATSSGKLMLAHVGWPDGPPPTGPLPAFTDSTITDLAALESELEVIRAQGYALCRGEWDASVWGVSAPLLVDRTLIGVISCWGPADRGRPERFGALGSLMRDAAQELMAV
jgi:IclR family transcriptional regulator, acetate operon repressor